MNLMQIEANYLQACKDNILSMFDKRKFEYKLQDELKINLEQHNSPKIKL